MIQAAQAAAAADVAGQSGDEQAGEAVEHVVVRMKLLPAAVDYRTSPILYTTSAQRYLGAQL